MKTKPFFCLLLACALPLLACGMFQPGLYPTQTAAAQTQTAASWTSTPTLTPTPTLTETPTVTLTPDPCSAANLPEAAGNMHQFMMRFDKLSAEAAQVPRDSLPDKITGLESVLQEAQAQSAPPCLTTLKDHQVKHMQLVIDTLKAFLDDADKPTIDRMVQQARDEHDAYLLELFRLLGTEVTPTPVKQVL